MIERSPLDMQARAIVIEIAERDLGDFVLPIDDAARLLDEALALDAFGHAQQIEIFPCGRENALADRLARVAHFVDQDDAVTHPGELRRRAAPGGTTADNDNI